MVAIAERFQGLRRPGASLVQPNKGLPSRPNENVLLRKAVNNSPAINLTTTAAATTTSAPTSPDITSRTQEQEQKDLPSLPPQPPPLPHVVSPPPPQIVRPPRVSSLNDAQQENQPPQANPVTNNLQLPQETTSRAGLRPVSEALSISQFIPDPEPEPVPIPEQQQQQQLRRSNGSTPSSNGGVVDGANGKETPASSNRSSSNSNNYIPPLPEPVIIAPLTKTHYDCYQSHRLMFMSNNVWYATACMTCKKLDQEIRHRCTFCSLRICSACFESLQKCKNRSLNELVATLA